MKWANGNCYEGAWLDGKKHGEGRLTTPKGKTRSGIWENDEHVSWNTDKSANKPNKK